MFIFDFIAKIKLLHEIFKLFKEYKLMLYTVPITFFVIGLFFYGLILYQNNSVYLNALEEKELQRQMETLLRKCGDKNSIGVAAISTDIKSGYHAIFKRITDCDFSINKQECFIDKTNVKNGFVFDSHFVLDQNTYAYLIELSKKDEVDKIYLPEWHSLSDYPTIKSLLNINEHYLDGTLKTLFLTSVKNEENNLIYSIHLASWGEEDCQDGRFLLNKFRNQLPLKK